MSSIPGTPSTSTEQWQMVYDQTFQTGVSELIVDVPLSARFVACACETNQNVSQVGRFNHEEEFPGLGWQAIARYPLYQGLQLLSIQPGFFAQYRLSFQQDVRYFSPLLVSLKLWIPTMPLSRAGDGGGATPVFTPSTQSIPSTVAASASSVTVLAANPDRKGATIWNASTATLYLDLDTSQNATVSATDYTVALNGGDYYEVPYGYTGIILGIWAAANGSALVREFE